MSLLQRITDTVRGTLTGWTMPAGESALWAEANTLGELCQLNISWLNGELSCTPWYTARLDVDEEIAPGLINALIDLNQAGFLTDNSQGAYDGPDFEASPWEAWVTGYADKSTYEWLVDVVKGTQYRICAWPPAGSRRRRTPPVGDRPSYRIRPMSEGDIAGIYRDCTDQAVDVLCAAWQVIIHDSQPGRNDMWALLQQAAEDRTNYQEARP